MKAKRDRYQVDIQAFTCKVKGCDLLHRTTLPMLKNSYTNRNHSWTDNIGHQE